MSAAMPIVFIVDDDISVRDSLELLIHTQGWQPETFASAAEFLDRQRALVPSCLILDLSLPGLDGLEDPRSISFLTGARANPAPAGVPILGKHPF